MTGTEKKLIDEYRRQDKGFTEIAAILNLSVNTVKSYCRRNPIQREPILENAMELEPPMALIPVGVCKQCGIKMVSIQNRHDKAFCCDKCRQQWWHAHRGESLNAQDHICPTCGQAFRTNRQQTYCSHSCYIKGRFGHAATAPITSSAQ